MKRSNDKTWRIGSFLLFLAAVILPVLSFSVWYSRQERQQRLDHALIEAIKKNDTMTAIALLDEGADANATDKPYNPLSIRNLLMNFWACFQRKESKPEEKAYTPALLLVYTTHEVYEFHEDRDPTFFPENIALTQVLLEHGADPDASDETGWTLLHLAACRNYLA